MRTSCNSKVTDSLTSAQNIRLCENTVQSRNKQKVLCRTTLPVVVKAKTRSDFVIKVVANNMKATTCVKNICFLILVELKLISDS